MIKFQGLTNGGSKCGYWQIAKFEVKQKERQVGLGEYVVKTLTKGFENKNHHVFCDNFFTSVKLFEDLEKDEKDGIHGCGTVRRDRKGIPLQLKNLLVCVCVCVRACVCVRPYVCVCVRMYVCVCTIIVYVLVYVCVYVWVCVCD